MEDKPFNIVDYIPGLTVDFYNNTSWDETAPSPYSSFAPSGGGSLAAFVYQSQIDISGWTKEGLTAFFSNQYIQRDGPYIPTGPIPAAGGLLARDWVFVTDVPLQVTSDLLSAGFPSDVSDYMTIKLGQGSSWIQSTTTPSELINCDSWSTGSGQPTASGTLYVTRVCQPGPFPGNASNAIEFPALRYVAQGIATAEPEFVYLNRLRRSYELQQL